MRQSLHYCQMSDHVTLMVGHEQHYGLWECGAVIKMKCVVHQLGEFFEVVLGPKEKV